VARPVEIDLDEYFPYLLNRVGAALVTAFETEALAQHDLSVAMWRVLAALSNDGGRRLIDLSAMTSIDVSTLSRMVTRLVRLGLVTRMRSKKSDREIVVELTQQGRTVLNRLVPIARRFEKTAIASVSQSDLAVLKRALRQMHENMKSEWKGR
jgi:MarR family transcriptional regulator, organic hydroperoxide resistance regulator